MRKDKISEKAPQPVQRKNSRGKSMAPPPFGLTASPVQAKSSGSGTLPEGVRGQMESAFNSDFSDVKVHPNSAQAESVGALAYTQGNDVHFASGQFNPGSKSGQELIGHELSHVVQQRDGRVAPTGQVGGMALNDSPSLENEADKMGKKAASGEAAAAPAQRKKKGSGASGSVPVQRFKMRASDINKYPRFAAFLQSEIPKAVNDARLAKYVQHFGENTGEKARNVSADMMWDNGPTIFPRTMSKSNASFRDNEGSDIIRISRNDIENYENANPLHEHLHRLALEAHIMNGYTTFLDDQDGKDFYGKEGTLMEKKTYGKDIKTLHDARNANESCFGKGEYKITVMTKSAGFAQRVVTWGTKEGYQEHEGAVGSSWTIKARDFGRWRLQIESNKNGKDSVKGWTKSKQLTTLDGDNQWTIRSEDWTDADRNDLVLKVERVENK